ncbi:DUF1796 family putative cysteine peptidase [Roseomonas elaeocarpi]|uniref:Uncharacterized protein n=1 Tax=Roseomonas elaeocarpi TaxID=907779 RepID=A0ABV6JYV0_9PROT
MQDEPITQRTLLSELIAGVHRAVLGREVEEAAAAQQAEALETQARSGPLSGVIADYLGSVLASEPARERLHLLLDTAPAEAVGDAETIRRQERRRFLPPRMGLGGPLFSFGTRPANALMLGRFDLRQARSPFDWLSCSPAMARHCLENDFQELLNIEHYEDVPAAQRPAGRKGATRHRFYEERFRLQAPVFDFEAMEAAGELTDHAPQSTGEAVFLCDGADGRIYSQMGVQRDGRMVFSQAPAGVALHGPYITLPPGRYRARVRFAEGPCAGRGKLDVGGGDNHATMAERPFDLGRLEAGERVLEVGFALAQPTGRIEVRLFTEAGLDGAIEQVSIVQMQESQIADGHASLTASVARFREMMQARGPKYLLQIVEDGHESRAEFLPTIARLDEMFREVALLQVLVSPNRSGDIFPDISLAAQDTGRHKLIVIRPTGRWQTGGFEFRMDEAVLLAALRALALQR